jgi:hypothetical protein
MMNALLEEAPADAPSLADVAAEKKQALKSKQTSGMQKFLAKFATIFTPLIPGFIAVGLLLGFATLAEQIFVLENAHPNATLVALIGYMKVFSKGMFTFLSILIGYNAQKAFGGSGVNGAIIARCSFSAITRKPPAASIPAFPPSSATASTRAAILSACYRRDYRRVGGTTGTPHHAGQPRYDPHLGGDAADHGRGDLYGDYADRRLAVYRDVVAVPAS